jgi:hypothetical protein
LGFIEGEGSFSIQKLNNYNLRFSIGQSSRDHRLMQEIQNFLYNLAGCDVRTNQSKEKSVPLYVSKVNKVTKSYMDMVSLDMRDRSFIVNTIVPFLDKLIWCSKKKLDFDDFKLISNLRDLGVQYLENGVEVLNAILAQMNSHRLSSSKSSKGIYQDRVLLMTEVDKLLKMPSNLEILEDGRVFIKSLNKIYNPGRASSQIALYGENGALLRTFPSILACAKYLGISNDSLSRTYLKKGKAFLKDSSLVYIKRV